VTGLSATNFKVEALIVCAGGALVDISRIAGGATEELSSVVMPFLDKKIQK
jgi:hypothetical protein